MLLAAVVGVLSAGAAAADDPLSSGELRRLGQALGARRVSPPRTTTRAGLEQTYPRIVKAVPFVVTRGGSGSAYVVSVDAATGEAIVVTNHHVVDQAFQEGGQSWVLLVFHHPELAKSPFSTQRILGCKAEKSAWCEAFRRSVRRAHVIVTDAGRDLALLRTGELPEGVAKLPHAPLAGVRPGQAAVVVGHPMDLLWTITTGIVSAVREQFPVEASPSHMTVVQTQAAINPGNSGGPLMNTDGEVIGVIFSKRRSAEGLNFAIGINEVDAFVAAASSKKAVRGPDERNPKR